MQTHRKTADKESSNHQCHVVVLAMKVDQGFSNISHQKLLITLQQVR